MAGWKRYNGSHNMPMKFGPNAETETPEER